MSLLGPIVFFSSLICVWFELLKVFLKLCCELHLQRSASEKPARVSSSKEPVSTRITTIVDTPLTYTVNDRIENSSFEKGKAEILASEGQVSSLSDEKEEDKPSDIEVPNDPEKITLEQAAIIVQACFRGHKVLLLVSLLLCA